MVILEFEPWPEAIAEARRRDLRAEESTSYAFELPVRFNVGGLEIFQQPPAFGGGAFVPLQLHDFAARGAAAVRELGRTGRADYSFPDAPVDVAFELQRDGVKIVSPWQRAAPVVPYDELLQAWEAFENRVRDYLVRETPELAANPFWGALLRGARIEDLPPYFGPDEDETGPAFR